MKKKLTLVQPLNTCTVFKSVSIQNHPTVFEKTPELISPVVFSPQSKAKIKQAIDKEKSWLETHPLLHKPTYIEYDIKFWS